MLFPFSTHYPTLKLTIIYGSRSFFDKHSPTPSLWKCKWCYLSVLYRIFKGQGYRSSLTNTEGGQIAFQPDCSSFNSQEKSGESFLFISLPILFFKNLNPGHPWEFSSEESTCQSKRHEIKAWSAKIPRVAEQRSLWTTATELVL